MKNLLLAMDSLFLLTVERPVFCIIKEYYGEGVYTFLAITTTSYTVKVYKRCLQSISQL